MTVQDLRTGYKVSIKYREWEPDHELTTELKIRQESGRIRSVTDSTIVLDTIDNTREFACVEILAEDILQIDFLGLEEL